MTELLEKLREPLGAFANNFRNRQLRRLQLAFAGSVIGEWAFAVALAVYAYRHGGATAVGLVALIRTIPAAIAAPFAGFVGDRFRREHVMLGADLIRMVLTGSAAALALTHSPAPIVYVIAAANTVTSRAFAPAQAAVLPSLAGTPEELTAANVVRTTIESVGLFVGPALGGLLLAATSPGVVFAVNSATFLWSASFIARLRVEEEPPTRVTHGVLREALAGFKTLGGEPRLRVLVGLFGAQTLVAGALSVLIVVMALDLLGLGQSGVGWLNSTFGVGGILGAVAAVALVGRRRLASAFGFGILLWGLPLVVIGLWKSSVVALTALAVLGLGNTIVDVAGFTLLQRAVPDEVLARAMAVMESMFVATIGLGAILAPLAISGLGIRGALVATGALLPVLAALTWTRLVQIDDAAVAPEEQLALLRGIPIFAPLPATTLEQLATSLSPVRFTAGTPIFHQGDAGDRFYVIKAGEVEISVDGASPKVESAGDYFGEIALLRNVPRTASVTARTDVELYALERDEFIGAVTGHARSADAADAVIGARLGALRPGVASV